MKIIVCVRQAPNGELSPFDACAYEEALKIKDAEITLLSMGPASAKDFLTNLTRLGAKKAVLLSDKAFAGADTLATAYTLSLYINKAKPDLVFCGRQTLVGDTAQVGPMLSVLSNLNIITNVLSINNISTQEISCTTRNNGENKTSLPALITVERINNLRLPSLFSKAGETEVLNASDINADLSRCGLLGSPTRVLKTHENQSGKRKCKFITAKELYAIINDAKDKQNKDVTLNQVGGELKNVISITKEPLKYAESVSKDITVIDSLDEEIICNEILSKKPNAVIAPSHDTAKCIMARVAAKLNLGLCADCTVLEQSNTELIMYRPASAGSIIAQIKSLTKPAMATVRTTKNSADIIVCAGFGAKDCLEQVKAFANKLSAELAASRKTVDNQLLPYSMQVGLTGKTVSPPVYIAIGISGAVHHIVGMQAAKTVIAINPDKDAPIFEYADYGIIANFEDIKKDLL